MVGGNYAKRNLEALALGGRLVHISSGGGSEFRVKLWDIMAKRAIITGSGLRVSELSLKREIVRQVKEKVWPHLGTEVTPIIDSVFPFLKAIDAHVRMESSEHMGKILLQINA